MKLTGNVMKKIEASFYLRESQNLITLFFFFAALYIVFGTSCFSSSAYRLGFCCYSVLLGLYLTWSHLMTVLRVSLTLLAHHLKR